ncbi:MAG: DUF6776 family protein [Pseudomonadota bacterium]
MLLAIAAGGYLAFELGRIQGGYSLVEASAEASDYRANIDALQQQVVSLKEEIALQETHREVERQAYSDVESNLVALQQKIQEQRDAIEFYRGIMSPEDGGRGLRVQGVKLSRGADEREYVVRLVLVQLLKHDRSVKGDVDLVLEGAQDGELASYSLEELVPADEDSAWPFQFRYFQTFDRSLILPDGFTPERLNVQIRSRTKSVDSVEQTFAWQTVQG